MNKIERLILENQYAIMNKLRWTNDVENVRIELQMDNTKEALNPTAKPIPYAESLVEGSVLHNKKKVAKNG